MKMIMKKRNKPAGREKGQALAEYCIVIALVSILALTGLGTMGERTAALFSSPFSSAEAETEKEPEEEEPVEEPPEGSVPLKIVGANGNLNFVYDLADKYAVGEEYTDNIGKTEIAAVYQYYKDIDTATKKTVITANFDNSFRFFMPVHTRNLFSGLEYLTTVTNTKNLRMDIVEKMDSMFSGAGNKAESFSIDVSTWDTSKVTDMRYAFNSVGKDNAKSVTIIGLGNWDVGNVTDMFHMFAKLGENAVDIDLGDLSRWNTGKVTSMQGLFFSVGRYKCKAFDIGNLDSWDVSSVTNMMAMFEDTGEEADSWNAGDLSRWNVSNVTDMSYMFCRAGKRASLFSVGNLSGWDVSCVDDMRAMFREAGRFNSRYTAGDLSAWNTCSATAMNEMFYVAWEKADYCLDLSGWNVEKVVLKNGFNDWVTDKVIPPVWKY